MEISGAIELLELERECVSRDCDRECQNCDLSQVREKLLAAYGGVIAAARYFQLHFKFE